MLEGYKTLRAVREIGRDPFTVEDLASRSGVSEATVRTVLSREGEFIEEIGRVRTGQRGASRKKYQLKESALPALSQRLAAIEAIAAPAPAKEEETSSAPSALLAAEETLLALGKRSLAQLEHEASIGWLGLDAGDAATESGSGHRSSELALHLAIVKALLGLNELEQAVVQHEELSEGKLVSVRHLFAELEALGLTSELRAQLEARVDDSQLTSAQGVGLLAQAAAGDALFGSELAELQLNIAEKKLLSALAAQTEQEAERLTAEVLAEVEVFGVDWSDLETAIADASSAQGSVPPRVARAGVLASMARYVGSDEAAGVSGPLWRDAFQALAAADTPEHSGLHRRLLVDLVRLADLRSASALPAPWDDDQARRKFFAALAWWQQGSDFELSAVPTEQLAAMGRELERTAPLAFPLMSDADRRLALEALTNNLVSDPRASIAVRTLLAARREADLATALVSEAPLGHPLWQSAAEWYVDIRERAELGHGYRQAVLSALHAALPPGQAESFVYEVEEECAPDELAGLIENPNVPFHLKARLERRVMSTVSDDAPDLESRASEAEFMPIGAVSP